MAITVKHSKVSTIPDGDDSSLVRPSDWNADHTLVGLGTMAEQNANNVNITGGSITGVSGIGTVTSVAATAGTGISVSGSPITTSGTLTITNTAPDQIVSLTGAGTTTVTGTYPSFTITSTGGSGGGDVTGPASSTDNAITRFDGTTGKIIQNSVVTIDDTGVIAGATSINNINYVDFNTTYATTLTEGQLGWDGNNTLALGMAGGNVIQHIGEDSFFYIKASSAITKGELIMFTGAVGASGVITGAPSTGITNPQYIVGIAAESIANNDFGLVQWFGEITGVNTNGFNEGDVLYYDSAVAGGLTNVFPTSGPIITVAAVAKKSSGGGVLVVRVIPSDRITASTGISVNQTTTGTVITNTAPDQTVSLTAGTGISTSGTYPSFTITNTAPDQTVSITGAGGAVVTGTYPSFTVTTPSGTVTSVSGTAPIASSGGATPAISISQATTSTDGYLSSTDWNTFNNKGNGTVTSVTGTAPVVSSGGATPDISMAAANGTTNGYLTSTDWTTFNGKGSGTVTSITAGTGLSGGTITGSGTIAIDSTVATLTGSQTLTNKTLTNPTITNYTETLYAPSAGSAFTVDLANGTVQKLTSNANLTVTLPSSTAGKSYVIIIAYGGTHTLTWAGGSTIKWAAGITPTATSVNGKFDIFSFFCDGTNTYASIIGQNY